MEALTFFESPSASLIRMVLSWLLFSPPLSFGHSKKGGLTRLNLFLLHILRNSVGIVNLLTGRPGENGDVHQSETNIFR